MIYHTHISKSPLNGGIYMIFHIEGGPEPHIGLLPVFRRGILQSANGHSGRYGRRFRHFRIL